MGNYCFLGSQKAVDDWFGSGDRAVRSSPPILCSHISRLTLLGTLQPQSKSNILQGVGFRDRYRGPYRLSDTYCVQTEYFP